MMAGLLLLCMILGLLSGCAENMPIGTSGSSAATPVPDGAVVEIGKDELPCTEEQLYQQLFDPANKIEVDLDMPDEELAKLQADFEKNRKSPIYRQADMTITVTADGKTICYRIPDVGVRMKGNTSRTDFYNAEEGIYNAIHLKIDFQETFDDEDCYGEDSRVWESEEARENRKDRTFATLEKLEMRWNKCYDATYLKESYAYELCRAYGVMAPMVNLCSLDWSGVHMGVYTVSEPVDKVFLEKRLPEAAQGGDLYKLGWTNVGATFTKTESIGIENELNNEFYCYDLKTNKKTSDHEALKNLITRLNSGNVTAESYAQLVDVENFLNFAAVSYMLGNPDDLRNNYNNCYIYFRADNGKAMFIPYDYDRCLGVTYEWDPYGDGMTTDDPFTDIQVNGRQENPVFLYSVVKGGFYVAEFAEVLQKVAASDLLKPETFAARFEQAKTLYGADAKPSRDFRNGNGRDWSFALEGEENFSFADYISAKQAALAGYLEDLDVYINHMRPVPATHYIRGDFNDWSSQDRWAMERENGLLTYTLEFDRAFRFKVYGEQTGEWYGVESLRAEVQPDYETDSHGNFCLSAGTYLVTFDPETEIVEITKK